MASTALVIGNGESRLRINLNDFKDTHVLVGCNAIHRDLAVDHLICCDHRMVREALENPSTSNSTIHVRDNWHHYFRKIEKNKNVKLLPDLPYQGELRPDKTMHWGSGPYAVLVAAQLNLPSVSLVGFDLYGRQEQVNNVYRNTENYSKTNAPAVDPSYWIYQIGKLFSLFPHIQFNIINTEGWKMPTEWQYNNVKKESIGVALPINTLYT
jgi:hypothetical protein